MVLLLAIVVWFVLAGDQRFHVGLKDRMQIVATIAQVATGLFVLGGLYYTANTLRVTQEGQITDRFTKAIEQLGKTAEHAANGAEQQSMLMVRLGGIYALERIARDSNRDYWPVMQVLTAYVRQHAQWARPGNKSTWPPLVSPGDTRAPVDIQAILTVLKQRKAYFVQKEPYPINLDRTDLTNGDLDEADLQKADFRSSCLVYATFQHARLESARMEETQLMGANLEGAHFEDAHLDDADLRGAHLPKAILRGTDLRKADLRSVVCQDLEGTDLRDAKLRGTDLRGADLSRVINLKRDQLAEAVVGEDPDTHKTTLKPPYLRTI